MPTTTTTVPRPDPTVDPELLGQLAGRRTVLAPTDHGRDPALARSRQAAARIASALDATLVLGDRSLLTWGDTPHVIGPRAGTDIAGTPFAPLESQVRAAGAHGVATVTVVAPTIPTMDATEEAVDAVGADVLVLPDAPARRTRIRRWLGDGDLVGRLRHSHPGLRIVVVHAAGRCRLAA